MKNTNKIVLVLMALVCLVLVGCPQPEHSTSSTTWSEITSLDGLDGTWVGTYTETVNVKDVMENSDTDQYLEINIPDVDCTVETKYTAVVKNNKLKLDVSGKVDMTEYIDAIVEEYKESSDDLTADYIWETMKLSMEGYESSGISLSEGRPYIYEITMSYGEMAYEDIIADNVKFYVNSAKTAVRYVTTVQKTDGSGSPIAGKVEKVTIILIKQ